MRSLLLATLLCACSVQAYPPKAAAQTPRFAIMDDYVRERLAAEWRTAQEGKAVQRERAYCLRYQLDIWAGEPAYRVTQIDTAHMIDATVQSASFTCPEGPDRAQLHVHPNHTCVSITGPCWKSGPYAWQCLPSDQDKLWLLSTGDAFSMVQCDEHAIVAFFPRQP